MKSKEQIQKHLNEVQEVIDSYQNELKRSTTDAHKKYCNKMIEVYCRMKYTLEWVLRD